MCLILVEKLMAEGRPLHIEGDGVVAGLQLVDYLEQHLGETVDGANHLAALAQGKRGQGVEGAVEQCIAVEYYQKRLFHEHIIAEGEGKSWLL
ncbi:hypothetical protein ES703_78789 [subsurface metagenome]